MNTVDNKYKCYDDDGNWIGINVFGSDGEIERVRHLFPWNEKLKKRMPILEEYIDVNGKSALRTVYPPKYKG